MKKVRVCLIGSGRAGMIHARNMAGSVPGGEIYATCDPDISTAEAAAEEAFLELPRLADDAASEEEAEPALEPFALDEPDFEVDYRLWLIEYADGSTRTFDSHAGTLA